MVTILNILTFAFAEILAGESFAICAYQVLVGAGIPLHRLQSKRDHFLVVIELESAGICTNKYEGNRLANHSNYRLHTIELVLPTEAAETNVLRAASFQLLHQFLDGVLHLLLALLFCSWSWH